MALYHFHVDRISRSKGQTAVSAAAYRSGEKLHDYYYGEDPDYTRKGGVLLTEIILPEHVPEEYRDREKLWNAVEAAEKNPKAQLAYSFDFALQNELDFDENVRIAREFIRENFTSRGMICDVAFHEPDKDPDEIPNPHVHVLVPMRPMNPDGTFGSKQRREYFLDENGNRLRDEKGKYIFNAVRVNDWGDAETLMTWRENWAKAVNEAFEAKGITERVDYRSYVDQGLDFVPTVHEGPAVRAMEKKGIQTEKGEWNRLIRSLNRNIRKLLGKIKSIMTEIAELKEEEKAARMEAERRKEEYRSDLDEVMAALKEYTDTKKEKNAYYGGKAWAEAVSFINRYNICRLDDFEKVVGKLYDDVYDINQERKAVEQEIKFITETFRYQKQFKENAPIYRKWYEMKPGRKKDAFAEAHRAEIQLYHVSVRMLKEKYPDMKIPAKQLTKRLQELRSTDSALQIRYQRAKKEADSAYRVNRQMCDEYRKLHPKERDNRNMQER